MIALLVLSILGAILAPARRALSGQSCVEPTPRTVRILQLKGDCAMADLREQEIRRWKEREKKDLEVEKNRGERPLEGFSGSGAGSTWAAAADDGRLSAEEHGEDKEKSEEASEEQAE